MILPRGICAPSEILILVFEYLIGTRRSIVFQSSQYHHLRRFDPAKDRELHPAISLEPTCL